MEVIVSQPYVSVSRSIEWNEQRYIEEEKYLELYENKVVTPTAEFNLKEVFDVSFRSSHASYGFLYLHTITGVYAYQVKTNPEPFIKAYKNLVKDHY